MYDKEEIDQITDTISDNNFWFGGRFAKGEREGYLERRYAVEQMLYDEFTSRYGTLKSKAPVYFYLIPDLNQQLIDSHLQARNQLGEKTTKYLIVDIDQLPDRSNISFTINDSFRSYRTKLVDKGIFCRPIINLFTELDDYGKVFHIDEMNQVHSKYCSIPDIRYEVQVWDPDILEDIRNNNLN